eukprot:TRINITY_DN29636_c0_g1_i1.p1 TRINITY_DN29636_c0_g1~~TRINITY_DN29636_c0_g1_i1.p1  ORF type:complete len:1823 (+),score=281.29 TRINITY_DN29636_c0_g1_i1:83-5470(+)
MVVAAVTLPLSGLESFALRLQVVLRESEVSTRVLQLLLDCCRESATSSRDEGVFWCGDRDTVADWCLSGERAFHEDDLAGTVRLLLLRHVVCHNNECNAHLANDLESKASTTVATIESPLSADVARKRCKEKCLAAAPQLLEKSGESLAATEFARLVAGLLPADEDAVEWLCALQRSAQLSAYVRAAEALLPHRGRGSLVAGSIWDMAVTVFSEGDAEARRLCLRRLLPPLVAATEQREAVERLTAIVRVLSDRGSGRAERSDALTLTVAFHNILLDNWGLTSFPRNSVGAGQQEVGDSGNVGDIGSRRRLATNLLTEALQSSLKERASDRKNACFLLSTAARNALSVAEAEVWLQAVGSSVEEAQQAWRCFWELLDALDASSSHLLKAGWEEWIAGLIGFVGRVASKVALGLDWPICIVSPAWIQVLMCRGLDHSNDGVQKFVLRRIVAAGQSIDVCAGKRVLVTSWLCDEFILVEVLPRLNHNIEMIFPRCDVRQSFEGQLVTFFVAVLGCESRTESGNGSVARRLLLSLLDLRVVHHTPLRLILTALLEAGTSGSLSCLQVFEIVERFFSSTLQGQPVNTRPFLAALFVRVVARLAPTANSTTDFVKTAELAAGALAAVPDALVEGSRASFAMLIRKVLGSDCVDACDGSILEHAVEVLRHLVTPFGAITPEGMPITAKMGTVGPMDALRLSLGVVRLIHAIASENPADVANGWAVHVWPVLRVAIAALPIGPPVRETIPTLFIVAYGSIMLPGSRNILEQHLDSREALLSFAQVRSRRLLRLDTEHVTDADLSQDVDAPWGWLYAYVLDHLWHPGLSSGEAALGDATEVLERTANRGTVVADIADGASRCENGACGVVVLTAIQVFCAVAPKVSDAQRRATFFLLALKAGFGKLRVADERFSIFALEDAGTWRRHRLEEHDDLHRVEREGFARSLEWRDVPSVFHFAKWRALSLLARSDNLVRELGSHVAPPPQPQQQNGAGTCDTVASMVAEATHFSPREIAQSLLMELDSLQAPQVAHWAVVARRVIYPILFAEDVSLDEQRTTLQVICDGLSSLIATSVGSNTPYIARGCLIELAAALCDPRLFEVEGRLLADEATSEHGARAGVGPLSRAMTSLLSLGEACVGVTRAVVVPLLVAIRNAVSASPSWLPLAADVLANILLGSEALIPDGACGHAPPLGEGTIEEAGPGSLTSLNTICPSARRLAEKFGRTGGASRVIALAALDTFADRADGTLPPLVLATMDRLLEKLRSTLDQLLKQQHGGGSGRTPMPKGRQHRTQLRGWQAVLVLAHRADAETSARVVKELFVHLRVPHVPDVRAYQDLLACLLCGRLANLIVEPLLLSGLSDFNAAVQVSASLITSACYLLDQWASAIEKEGCHGGPRPCETSVACAVIPYLSHNAAHVRGMAGWGLFRYLNALGPGMEQAFPHEVAALIANTLKFLEVDARWVNLRDRLKPIFVQFDPVKHAALECLTEMCDVLPPPLVVGGHIGAQNLTRDAAQVLHTFEDLEFVASTTVLERVKDEVTQAMEAPEDRADPSCYPVGSEEWRSRLAVSLGCSVVTGDGVGDPISDGGQNNSTGLELPRKNVVGAQRKFAPEAPPARWPQLEQVATIKATTMPQAGRARAPLVVVASLVDLTVNLAGISRTSEVFNCEALFVRNAGVVKDASFKTISVNSEKWLPINEVPRGAPLTTRLVDLRSRGYTLVGVEQTHDSVPLDKFMFPKRTVLVLGNEKQGIDAELLSLLDVCVEIPQWGQLRSLNVHASGNVTIWEYARQQLCDVSEPCPTDF